MSAEKDENAAVENMEDKSENAEMKDAKEAKETAPAETAKPVEAETDAPSDNRPKIKLQDFQVSKTASTFNCIQVENGLLKTLTDGGAQHLMAAARTTVGIKTGRYMFEVRMLETHNRAEKSVSGGPQRHLVRVGVSTAESSLLLGDGTADSVFFDFEGFFSAGRNRKKVCKTFIGRFCTASLLVNLDSTSPNANTVSLFKDGSRLCEPQPIPEHLVGKVLYPVVAFKNATVQVNTSSIPLSQMPFKCRTVGDAAAADVVLTKASAAKVPEVVFPIGLPGQGYFDWTDLFAKKHPDFTELSDRKLLEWAAVSGQPSQNGSSNDKPLSNEDPAMRRLLRTVAPCSRRNFVIPELRENLLATERKQLAQLFKQAGYKVRAVVVVGQPTADYKSHVESILLEAKKKKQIDARKRAKAEEARNKLIEERKRRLTAKKEGVEVEENKVEEEPQEEEITVELDAEEKAIVHRKTGKPDITDALLSKSYSNFALPTEEEGFDAIEYVWSKGAEATKVVKDWVFAQKLSQRVQDIKIGEDFKTALTAWNQNLKEWKSVQIEWKDPKKRKALLAKRAEAKKASEEGEENGKDKSEDCAAVEKTESMEVDWDDLDTFKVEDVLDIGDGRPLFSDFAFEDWALLSVRYEIILLLHSFKKDLADPDRPSFAEKDLAFYYNKYYKKPFSYKAFGVETVEQFQELVRDTFTIAKNETGFLEALLDEQISLIQYVRITEEFRRERIRRLDAGDESAELKFPRSMPSPPTRPPGAKGNGKGSPRPYAASPPGASYQGGSAQKRAYTPSGGSYLPAKQPRTYGGYGGYGRR